MTTCQIDHEIKFANINTNQLELELKVTNEIVLISGNVSKPCASESVLVRNKETGVESAFEVGANGCFKALLRLVPGEQTVCVEYCCKKVAVKYVLEQLETPYTVQPLYIVCRGDEGRFQAATGAENTPEEACRIIDLNMRLVQCLFAEKLHENGFGRLTFTLRGPCAVFESDLQAEYVQTLSEREIWSAFGREILSSVFADCRLKVVAFISCTKFEPILDGDYSYANIKRHTKAHAALGAGGLALFGSGYFYAWPHTFAEVVPCFKDDGKVDLRYFMDDSNHRRTLGGVFATTLGAVAHEMGHVFDLGHTEEGIMGSGFDYLNRVFTTNNLTEDLPNRQVRPAVPKKHDSRLTRVQKTPNRFLDRYHEQKLSDSVTLSRNCAVILGHHRWLRPGQSLYNAQIDFDRASGCVRAQEPLKLVELRDQPNALLVDFFEFPDASTTSFSLPKTLDCSELVVFVICTEGSSRLFE